MNLNLSRALARQNEFEFIGNLARQNRLNLPRILRVTMDLNLLQNNFHNLMPETLIFSDFLYLNITIFLKSHRIGISTIENEYPEKVNSKAF